MVAVHLTDLFLFYTADRKALMMALPLKHGTDTAFKKAFKEKDHSWREVLDASLHRWTLEELAAAAEKMEKDFARWLQVQKKRHGKYLSGNGDQARAFTAYFESSDFRTLAKDNNWGKGVELRYSGFMFDKVTPLKHYGGLKKDVSVDIGWP